MERPDLDPVALKHRFDQINARLAEIEQEVIPLREEAIRIDERLKVLRDLDTYTPGPGHSNTIDHAQPEATP